jgi:predicted outer membrane repeat protein
MKHNYPNDRGAAIYLGHVSITISNCTFTNGYATFGGAVYADYSDLLVIDSCTFKLNNSGNGGGIYLDHCTQAVISNCFVGQNESEST